MASNRRSAPRRTNRRYTAQEKQAALKDALRLGVSDAARKHGVPHSTLSTWRGTNAEREHTQRLAPEPEPEVLHVDKDPGAAAVSYTTPQAPTSASRVSRVARSYTPSQKAEILEYAAAHGVTDAHKEYDVSRFTIYDWQRKVRLAAEGKGDSPTCGPDHKEIESQRDKEILNEWHRHPGLGPSQIKNQLRRRGVKVSVHTTRRVMQEAGYRPPKVRRQGHDERFEAVRPKVLWRQSSTCSSL